MELNTMLSIGRSDLSGFNEGTTRQKLFAAAMSPTSDTFENVSWMQRSPNTSLWRSSNPSTPPKRSILRGGHQVTCLNQGSPSSLRSVRFSDDEDDLAVECAHIHVNESTQTPDVSQSHDDSTRGTQRTNLSRGQDKSARVTKAQDMLRIHDGQKRGAQAPNISRGQDDNTRGTQTKDVPRGQDDNTRGTQTNDVPNGQDDNTRGTQTSVIPRGHVENARGAQTTVSTTTGSRPSVRESYIESVGSPKAQRVGSRSPSLTRDHDDRKPLFTTPASHVSSKPVQRSMQHSKIIQSMDVTPITVKEDSVPDGHKIIQNLDFSKTKNKQIQTEDLSKFASESTQTPLFPDGKRIIRNMDLETPKSKHESVATQTPSIPDGSKIIQNMEPDSVRAVRQQEPALRHTGSQTGHVSESTQTPVFPDGSKIIKNMEADSLRTMRQQESALRHTGSQTGHVRESTQTPVFPDGSKIIQNMEADFLRSPRQKEPVSRHTGSQTGYVSENTQTPVFPDGNKITRKIEKLTPREDDSASRSISVQTNPQPLGGQHYVRRTTQSMAYERVRSPSPESIDCSFGFDVNTSFASTQTDERPIIQEHNTDMQQQEPVLIYDGSGTGSKHLVISHDDVVGPNKGTSGSHNGHVSHAVTLVPDKSKLTNHSAKTLLERHTYSAETKHHDFSRATNTNTTNETQRITNASNATFRNSQMSTSNESTQTNNAAIRQMQTSSGTLTSPQGSTNYKASNTSIHEKLMSRSYTGEHHQYGARKWDHDLFGLRADQWMAPTIPTKLRSNSPLRSEPGSRQEHTKPAHTKLASAPLAATRPGVSTLYMDDKSLFRPQMTSSMNDIPNCSKDLHRVSPTPRQPNAFNAHGTGQKSRESRLDRFSRSAIDVYSFDPDSVQESKRVLSQSVHKESVTKNAFLKGIDLPVPASVTPRATFVFETTPPETSGYPAAPRPYSLDPYVRKVNLGRGWPVVEDRKYNTNDALHSSRYTNLGRSCSAGSISSSSEYRSNYGRSKSPSGSHTMDSSSRGYRPVNLTPTLNQMRTSVIRKNSMNASSIMSTHASRPNLGSSSEYSFLAHTKGDNKSSAPHSLEHRSRPREPTRGTNSAYARESQNLWSTALASERNRSPLYIESLTDASNVRPRSRERYSRSRSPCSKNNDIHREHDRSRSSSATRTVSRKPPLPQAAARKQSPSPRRRSLDTLQGRNQQTGGQDRRNRSPSRYSPRLVESQAEPHWTSMSAHGNGVTQIERGTCKETREHGDLDPSKVTIGRSPPGLLDMDCVYLDERTIQRIIESASL